ncbi:MAG: ATP-binding cassette domain-containing protein [Terrimicrobiaceae bacterium]|nr:ATP-binding cassette domain-containing protein [Terrimicrobiaceae bacterium]
MIKVENLTKRYGGVTAVDGISFHVGKGEIVGFLGPNGAGKSTTMRMLSCYLPPTSGRAEIAGFDVFRNSLKARERIGYMPENVPLYNDMRVFEYLKYRAALKGVRGRRMKERVGDVMDLCALRDVERKLVGNLSKGYRQRVGLADAMVHEPDLLILDEPTIGLDPNQIRQVRELIRNLGRHHTILLSTHILPEVEMTCSRVMIINRGRIEAADAPENLRARLRTAGDVRIEVRAPDLEKAKAALLEVPGVLSAASTEEDGWGVFALGIEAGTDPREAIWNLAVSRRWAVRELSRTRVTLEDVFAEVTHPDE